MTLEIKNFGNFQNSLISSLLLAKQHVPHAIGLEIKCFEKALVRRLLYICTVGKVEHLFREQGNT